jgi:maltose O-acetyltransferase
VTGANGILVIGDRVRLAHGVAMCAHASLEIGDDTTFGPFAMVLDVDFHGVQARGAPAGARPVRIGRNVHIGAGTIVLRGAVIGDGVVVAPNSVVSRWVPAGLRVAGVPAKPVRDFESVHRNSDPRV